jgi:hypothetical protein
MAPFAKRAPVSAKSCAHILQRPQVFVLEQVTLTGLTSAAARGAVAAALSAEFPSVFVSFDASRDDAPPHLHASEWASSDFDFWNFDCAVDDLAQQPFTLTLADDRRDGTSFPLEVLIRCQRAVGRRNRHSQSQQFDRVLAAHRALHDLNKPLVRADYNHALDVWQWILRLDPAASPALQFAALFHDIERLISEADVRVEQHAPDYQQFKDEHARNGAELACQLLRGAGIAADVAQRAAAIIVAHERRSDDAEVTTLNDADALSFFSLNSSGYANYFGPEQTRKKIAWTWNRMSAAARARTKSMRLRHDVRALLDEQGAA